MHSIEHVVTKDEDGSRVDRIVRDIIEDIGYVSLQKMFRLGKVRVNEKKTKADFRVRAGDLITVFTSYTFQTLSSKETVPEKKSEELKSLFEHMVIYENDDFCALNKPSGLAVQAGSKVRFCVADILKVLPEKYFLVHRLDKDTSGVLLIAKHQRSARELTKLFRDGRIKKTYWAVVDGKINNGGVIRNFISKSFTPDGERMIITEKGQLAVTRYNPLKRLRYFTLLELKPETGRKHQLRVHCANVLASPILGDKKYNKNCQHSQMFLHAHSLEILGLNIDAPLPSHFEKLMAEDGDETKKTDFRER